MTPRHALALLHAPPEAPGYVADALAERGIGLRAVRLDAGAPVPDALGEAAALVVLGAAGGYAPARPGPLAAEARLVESALGAALPVLGIGRGSQLLAHVLGAAMPPAAAPERGWAPVTRVAGAPPDPLFSHAPARFTPFHWHAGASDLPGGAVALLRSEGAPLQAFRYDGPARAYGLLFHLEATPAGVNEIVRRFADEARAAGTDPERLLAETGERLAVLRPIARTVLARWASLVAGDDPYLPIACGFHDRLESHAVRGAVVLLEIRGDGAESHTVKARIADVFTRDGGEYARLLPEDDRAPFEVRLDKIVAVGGTPRPETC